MHGHKHNDIIYVLQKLNLTSLEQTSTPPPLPPPPNPLVLVVLGP